MTDILKEADDQWRANNPEKAAQIPLILFVRRAWRRSSSLPQGLIVLTMDVYGHLFPRAWR